MNNKLLIVLLMCLTGACGGAAGEAGPQGLRGITGTNGTNGTNGINGNVVTSGIACVKTDSSMAGITITYNYQSVNFTNGDRFVGCSLIGNSTQYSNSAFYKVGISGATTGACLVTGDIDVASNGYWNFTSQSGTTKTVYNDTTSSNNNHTYIFLSGDCVTF